MRSRRCYAPCEILIECAAMPVTIEDVLLFCSRFDRTVDALTNRDRNKPPFLLADEYDVQDLAYGSLKPIVEDLLLEDPTGKVAGTSGRLDITSRSLGLVIEVKAALKPRREEDIPRECFERIKQYSLVPGMRVLAFFIYDPANKIKDADNFQRDLEGPHLTKEGGTFMVRVVGPGFMQTFEKTDPSSAAPIAKPRREMIEENDALNLLSSWFNALSDMDKRAAITYAVLDHQLDLPDGTTKKHIAQAVSKYYEVDRKGEDTIKFKYRDNREKPYSFGSSKRKFGGF